MAHRDDDKARTAAEWQKAHARGIQDYNANVDAGRILSAQIDGWWSPAVAPLAKPAPTRQNSPSRERPND